MTNRVTTKPSRARKRAIRIGPRKRKGEGLISKIGGGGAEGLEGAEGTGGRESGIIVPDNSPPGD